MYAVKIKVDNDSWPIKRIEDRYYRAISVDHCLKCWMLSFVLTEKKIT